MSEDQGLLSLVSHVETLQKPIATFHDKRAPNCKKTQQQQQLQQPKWWWTYRAVQNALTILIIFCNALIVKHIMRLFSVSVDCLIETKKNN